MTRSLVFIDARVPDLDHLLDGVLPGAAAHVLAPNRDALRQIADILAAETVSELAMLTLVGHGRPGAIEIGSTALDEAALSDDDIELTRIADALAPDAQVLVCGCDVGYGETGRRFVYALSAALDGRAVAAASYPLGEGRAWDLDVSAGDANGAIPFPSAILAAYRPRLAITFTSGSTGTFPNIGAGSRTAVGDFNGDGAADILYQTVGDGSAFGYALNNGNGTFTIQTQAQSPFAGLTLPDNGGDNYRVADFNGDGRLDLYAGENGSAGSLFINDGTTFSLKSGTNLPSIGAGSRTAVGDFNGDGAADILYQTVGDGSAFGYALNNGNGTFTIQTQAQSPFAGLTLPDNGGDNYRVADFNGDGRLDLYAGENGSAGSLFINDGTTFSLKSGTNLPSIGAGARTAVGDFDSDGDADILYQTVGDGSAFGYARNNGDGTFTIQTQAQSPFAGRALPDNGGTNYRVTDFDKDGDVDIFAGINGTTGTYLVQGSNSGGNGAPPKLATSTPANSATGVAPAANIVLTFDEAVFKGTGNIEIVRLSDNTVVQTIAVTDPTVTVSGSTVTIDPPSDLAGLTQYGVRIARGAFVDSDGAIYFSPRTAPALSFTTANPNTPPSVGTNAGLTLNEGATAAITATQLAATDPEQGAAALTYTVTAQTNGTVRRNGTALGLNGTFTQADIAGGLIGFAHDGGETTSAGFGFSLSDGQGGTVTGQSFAITVNPVNDPPVLTATAANPTFSEGAGAGVQGADAVLFAAASAGTVESGQTVTGLTLTVAGLADGAAEALVVGGTAVQLTQGNAGTAGGVGYAVAVSAGTATVTLTSGPGLTPSAANTLIDGLAYRNTNPDNPTPGTRTVTLTGIRDSGGTANGGSDSTVLGLASSVTVAATNDAPVLDAAKSPTLGTQRSDVTAAPAGSVGTLVSQLVANGSGIANVTDPDLGALTGLALTATDTGQGTWWYSTNGGTAWSQVGAVSDAGALLLAADTDTRLYFQSNGTPGTLASALLPRAWDRTGGTAGAKVDTAANGGTTAFSAATDTASLTLQPPGPTVSAGRITLTGNSGTGGAFKIGDTVTARWDNSATGDNNGGVTAVTMDFSAFGGGSTVTAIDNGSGVWSASFAPSGAIDATGLAVAVSATDVNGRTTTSGGSATVDTIAPTVTDPQIAISGATGANGTYKIGDTVTATWTNTGGDNNTDTIASVAVDFSAFGGGTVAATASNGVWTATYALAAGAIAAPNRNVTVTATDNAGNATTTADGTNATVDTVAPAAPTFGTVAGDDRINAAEKTGTVTLGGTAEAGSTVTLSVGGQTRTATLAGTTWRYDLVAGDYTALGEGAQTVTATATDAAGNTGPAGTKAFTIDSAAPAAPTFGTVAGDDRINAAEKAGTVTLGGTAEAGSTVTLSVGGQTRTATLAGTTWRYDLVAGDYTALGEGAQTVTATATDAAGNTGPAGTKAFTIDSAAPAAPTFGTVAGDDRINAAEKAGTVTLGGTAEAGSTVTLSVGGQTRTATLTGTTWSYDLVAGDYTALGEGAQTVTATATDAAGNVGQAGAKSFTVDTLAPASPVVTSQNLTSSTAPTLTGTAEAGAAVTLTIGGASYTTAANGGGGWSVDLGTAPTSGSLTLDTNGTNAVSVSARDAAGNVSALPGTQTLTIDTTAPAAPGLALATDSGGSASDGISTVGTVAVTGLEPGGSWTYSTDGGTTWTPGAATSFTLAAGSYAAGRVRVRQTDAAGNTGSAGSLGAVTVDAAAPALASATVDGARLVLTFTDATALEAAGPPPASAFAVTAGGSAVAVNAVAVDAAARTVTLTLAAAVSNGQAVTLGYTDPNPNADDAAGVVQDLAGNDAAGFAGRAVSNTTAAPPPPPPPEPPTTTVDGVTVTTTTTTNTDGSTSTVVTIPVVTAARAESVGGNTVADIPLVTSGGASVLAAQVPTGYGLTASGPGTTKTAGTSLADLIREIRAHTDAGSSDQLNLTGGGSSFLGSLPTEAPLVQTIVPSLAPGSAAPGTPLVITGQPVVPGTPLVALVIDTRGLPADTRIELQNVAFAAVIGPVSVSGGDGAQVVFGDDAAQSMVLGADDDTLHGGGGNDVVGSRGGNDMLYGDAGDDTVFGGIGNDTLFGGGDRDIVYGNQDADLIYGNQGADSLYGGQGDDRAYGGQGDDRISGNVGADRLFGNQGADVVYGNQGADLIYGNQGADTLFGGQDADTLFGGQDGDIVYGNLGQDVVYGNMGADILYGGQGADTLYGGQGDDVLAGGVGDDVLVGGLGADRYVFGTSSGRDLILGFDQTAGDRIALGGQTYTLSSALNGDAVLTLSGGGSVELSGIRAAQVSLGFFT